MDGQKPTFDKPVDLRGGRVDSSKPSLPRALGRARRRLSPRPEATRAGVHSRDVSLLQKAEALYLETKMGIEETLMASLTVDSQTGEGREIMGRRGMHRGLTQYVVPPEVDMKPEKMAGKEGLSGTPIPLLVNYFALRKLPSWSLYQHRVDFSPEEDDVRLKKGLIRSQAVVLGAYVFDGTCLYSHKNLGSDGPLILYAERKMDKARIEMKLRMVRELNTKDGMYDQFFNLVVRKCLYGMGLELMGRNFFDHNAAIKVPTQRLELWPGFLTSVRRHDDGVMLCVEMTHKVLRLDNVLNLINGLKNSRDFRRAVEDELCGNIVMTHYNRRTYRIDDIAWNVSPKDNFDRKGSPESYAKYYESRYNIRITDMNQPLLVARPREKDFHKAGQEGLPKLIYLVPETCQMTGLSDAMRANMFLMRDLAKHLHTPPAEKVTALSNFMKRFLQVPANSEELEKWGLAFDSKMVQCKGRVFGREGIVFAGPKPPEPTNEKADWTMAFRSRQMLSTVNLERWIMLVPQRDAPNVDNLVKTMSNVAKPLNMFIRPPLEVVKLLDMKPVAYAQAIEKVIKQNNGNLQLLFIILPNNKADVYAAVKRRMSVDYGIPSQCFLSKNVTAKGLMSIATKVVIQINAKLGGEPWTIQLPMKNIMFVGFDVYHGAKGSKGSAVGALVSSTSPNFASYFSTVSFHKTQEEMSHNLTVDLGKAIQAYERRNTSFPERIIFFRDGVGDGQMGYVFYHELTQINACLGSMYGTKGLGIPRFSFIVVTKKINTRLFTANGRPDNPPPGTILDNTITLPHRYDFFLIAAGARQGTVSPCSYTVLYDTQGLDADKLQRVTYKMCHMYYNWSGTVAIPAPCQYAHKLAYLTGLALGATPSLRLQHVLHFL